MAAENKVLTQREIDALLQENVSGPSADRGRLPVRPAKSVKIYDFRRPDKFSKDHMRTLQAMHQALARVVSANLSSQLRTAVNVKLSSIDQGLYEEYLQQIQTPSILNVVSMSPLDGSSVIGYGIDLGMAIVDRLLGGPGTTARRSGEVTDIEASLLRNAATPLLAGIAESWENLIELQPTLQDIAFSPQFLQVARASDVVIMVLFEMQIGETLGGMSICLPFTTLEPVMPRLNAQSWFSTPGYKQATENDREDLRRHLLRTPVEMSARLGTASLTTEEIISMQVGDVIKLECDASADLDVHIVSQHMFRASPGIAGRKLAIRMSQVLTEDERVPEEVILAPAGSR